jgi:hypothetical protein
VIFRVKRVVLGFRGIYPCHRSVLAHNIHKEHCFGCHYPTLAIALPTAVTLAEGAIESRRKPQNRALACDGEGLSSFGGTGRLVDRPGRGALTLGVRSIGFLCCAFRRHSDSIEVTPAVLVPSAFDGALRRHTVAGFDFPLYRLAEQSFLPFLRFCAGGCGLSLGAVGNNNDSCRFGLTALARERFI